MKPTSQELEEEEKFRVRSYGKSELAALYMPDITLGAGVTLGLLGVLLRLI